MTNIELKAERKRLGLSIADMARQLECSARTYCRWESGQSKIPAGAIKLFRILNGLEAIPPQTVRVGVTNVTTPPQTVRVGVTNVTTHIPAVHYVTGTNKT